MGTREIEELNKQRKQEALEEEMRQKSAKDKAAKRFNYVFEILLVLLSVIFGSLLGALRRNRRYCYQTSAWMNS